MRSIFFGLFGLTMAAGIFAACGDDTVDTSNGCTPGQSSACTGNNGCNGFQLCNTDGQSFGACECGSTGTGSRSSRFRRTGRSRSPGSY